jgi:hypothetical protein
LGEFGGLGPGFGGDEKALRASFSMGVGDLLIPSQVTFMRGCSKSLAK